MKLATALLIYFSTSQETINQYDQAKRVLVKSQINVESLWCRDNLSALSKNRLKWRKQGHKQK